MSKATETGTPGNRPDPYWETVQEKKHVDFVKKLVNAEYDKVNDNDSKFVLSLYTENDLMKHVNLQKLLGNFMYDWAKAHLNTYQPKLNEAKIALNTKADALNAEDMQETVLDDPGIDPHEHGKGGDASQRKISRDTAKQAFDAAQTLHDTLQKLCNIVSETMTELESRGFDKPVVSGDD
ncbi:MAG: hypothetical protein Q9162_001564 [Coniocarpon cinnabarinum]